MPILFIDFPFKILRESIAMTMEASSGIWFICFMISNDRDRNSNAPMAQRYLVETDSDAGYQGEYLPSSVWRMHLDFFAARTEAQAVVETRSPHATAPSCLRQDV
jgi:hypothetical protein